MNFLWGNIFEFFKERRHAALFIASMFSVFGVILLACGAGQFIRTENLRENAVYIVPGVGIFFAAWMWFAIQRIRARRKNRYQPSPLSRDELRKARSKLVKAKE